MFAFGLSGMGQLWVAVPVILLVILAVLVYSVLKDEVK